jgi:sugar phosphate isomerase/epimerase
MKVSRRLCLRGLGAILTGGPTSSAAKALEHRRDGVSTQPLGLVIHSYAVRQRHPEKNLADPLAFLDHARALGAAGCQTALGERDERYVEQVRQFLDRHQMYLEGTINLPRDPSDASRFEAQVRSARACGVGILRTVMLSGRRYETFESADAVRRFASESFSRLRLAVPIVERHGMKLAVENHKDWRSPDLIAILKRIDSPHVGVCLDTGNSIALLEDPFEVIEQLAPHALTTHFKDVDLREYKEGFLLAEVPLGTGVLDLPRVARTLRAHQPDIRLNLEMITRDPLKVPCLTPNYWATFEDLPGRFLAATLTLARQRGSREPLPTVSDRTSDDQLRLEDDNIARSLAYARQYLAAHS